MPQEVNLDATGPEATTIHRRDPAGRGAAGSRAVARRARGTGPARAVAVAVWAACCIAGGGGCAPRVLRTEPVYFPRGSAAPRVVHLASFDRIEELSPRRLTFVERIRGVGSGRRVIVPAGVAWRDGRLYVCDTGDNVVHAWDLDAGRGRVLGERVLVKPVAVAVDAAGLLYVADTGASCVTVLDASGSVVRRMRPEGRERYRPVSVALFGNKLYASDIEAHQVDVYATADGSLLDSIGGTGSEPGRFYFPMGVATDAAGRVFVSDLMNGRVHIFDAEYSLIRAVGRLGDRYGDLGGPKHLAVGPGSTLFIADAGFAHVQVFDDRGRLLMLFGGPGDQPGDTPMPLGVTVAVDVPAVVSSRVPADFEADYFLFVTNTIGRDGVSLFAVGHRR